MRELGRGLSDEQFENLLAYVLRGGVIIAAAIVAAGGAVYLFRHGGEPMNGRKFHAEPAVLETPIGILERAANGSGRGLIQLGLLVLISTPIIRVIFSVFAFARQRDYTYVLVTAVVLAILMYSLFHGHFVN